ncbi:YehR family protein [Listeria monocytogenes]|uniref:YehR family lipoprotein n=1 Tax=Listeria monocytogenes TaxID=1639 RepID=UPI000BDFECF4|nr:YehR family protein [Listeria monocytogenes]EGR8676444.1 YehR family protein [Listeria monocytogenes]MCB2613330.1 YehR family protein [Listeria monocytogenes]MCB2619356.1 YehR family protein [Listeria monocytogenes]MCB2669973.1 YehR family protein [Listeria monocytogenes]MCB2675422.1 YehR family protein [Listeria monocytogenes]
MKKFLSILSILVLALLVTACGSDSSDKKSAKKEEKMETVTYIADINGAKLEATFSHVGDNLRKVDQKMVYPLTALGLESGANLDDATKKQLEEQVASQYSAYKESKGASLEMKFTDEALELTMSVDLYKADKDSVASLLGGTTDPKNVSLKETVKQFEAQGFKKKES